MACGDPGRFRQVLVNLMDNAVKFTRTGEVELLAADGADAAGIDLHATVRDTGIGIAADKLEAIFAAFPPGRRFHHPRVRRHRPGAFHLPENRRTHGVAGCGRKAGPAGARPSTSPPGWPRRQRKRSPHRLPYRQRPRVANTSTGAGGRTARVLLAEDNPVNRRLAETLLSRAGCTG